VDEFGRIDVLINNAGNFYAGFFEEITADDFRAQIETNLFGQVNVTRAVLPQMRAQRSGLIREILLKMCSGKSVDDYVFGNPETGKPFTDIKRSFHTACRMARIEGLWWHDLRATFCTRLALSWI
jgi:NAD(P)-dependent dehydrogenase (short-subunit alcohol dehydrogenase family)